MSVIVGRKEERHPLGVGLLVGEVVGEVDGAFVGEVVGEVDGSFVGEVVGETDGSLVGEVVGETDGSLVGEVVGDVDGKLDDKLVGEAVGALDGEVVGALDGKLVGELDGDFVGAKLGEFVDGRGTGCAVTSKFDDGEMRHSPSPPLPPLVKFVAGTTSKRTTSEPIPKSTVLIDTISVKPTSGITADEDPVLDTNVQPEHATSPASAL